MKRLVPLSWLLGLTLLASAGGAAAQSAGGPCRAPDPAAGTVSGGGALTVTFLGTTSLLFDDGQTQILIDGYFSRPPLWRAFLGQVAPDQRRIASAMWRANIGTRLRAVFVAHSHVDHVLDAPTIASETGADLVGSPSVVQVGIGHGLLPDERIKLAQHGVACGYGAFKITPFRAPHSTPNLVRHDIGQPVPRAASARRYRADDSHVFLIEHGGHGYLVYPSAAYEPGLLKGRSADVVFLGIGGLGRKDDDFANAYWAETVSAVGANQVYPIHWDNFGRPLGKGLRDMPRVLDNVPRGRAHLARLAKAHRVKLGALTPYRRLPLSQSANSLAQ